MLLLVGVKRVAGGAKDLTWRTCRQVKTSASSRKSVVMLLVS